MERELQACPACGAGIDGADSPDVRCASCGKTLVRAEGKLAAAPDGHVELEHHDYVGGKIGMWLFLFTELLLFGGMFLIYSIYRAKYAKEFHVAALELNGGIGTLNTLLLLTSSLTVALAIAAIRRGRKGACLVYLWATVAQGVGFMINKYFEWNYKFHHGFFPWKGTSKGLGKLLMEAKITEGESTFYNLYFVMTGLHGLHVLVGVVLLAVMVGFVMRDWVRKDDYGWLENSGLYWHLVDLIWIFLFPLFYLIS